MCVNRDNPERPRALRSEVMANYAGQFTLIDSDGAEHRVEGRYRSTTGPGGLRSWSGSFSATVNLGNLAGQQMTLRLPNGQQGTVLINNLTFGAGPAGVRAHGEFMGTGPEPAAA